MNTWKYIMDSNIFASFFHLILCLCSSSPFISFWFFTLFLSLYMWMWIFTASVFATFSIKFSIFILTFHRVTKKKFSNKKPRAFSIFIVYNRAAWECVYRFLSWHISLHLSGMHFQVNKLLWNAIKWRRTKRLKSIQD